MEFHCLSQSVEKVCLRGNVTKIRARVKKGKGASVRRMVADALLAEKRA